MFVQVNIVNSMNKNDRTFIPDRDVSEFQGLVESLFHCCQERMQYQSERFNLPDAELRCLLLFHNERYLTSKSLAARMNVAKSRVTKLVTSLIKKDYLISSPDPNDSRMKLLSVTQRGGLVVAEIVRFRSQVHKKVLEQFSPEQRAQLLNCLTLLSRHMKSVKDMMI